MATDCKNTSGTINETLDRLARGQLDDLARLETEHGLDTNVMLGIYGTELLEPDMASAKIVTDWTTLLEAVHSNCDINVGILHTYTRPEPGVFGIGNKPKQEHHSNLLVLDCSMPNEVACSATDGTSKVTLVGARWTIFGGGYSATESEWYTGSLTLASSEHRGPLVRTNLDPDFAKHPLNPHLGEIFIDQFVAGVSLPEIFRQQVRHNTAVRQVVMAAGARMHGIPVSIKAVATSL